ncbi:MAG: hypothetical protein V9G24_15950 [Rhodoblastus sp.]
MRRRPLSIVAAARNRTATGVSCARPAGATTKVSAESRPMATPATMARPEKIGSNGRSSAGPAKCAATKGDAAPIAAPINAPARAISIISTSTSAKATPPDAPTALRIAIDSRLRSTKAPTAIETPTPPTISDTTPISAMYCVKRSTLRVSCGETLARVRASQPAVGKRLRMSSAIALTRSSLASGFASASRVTQRVKDAVEPRPLASNPSREIITREPKPMPVAMRSGSERISPRNTKCALPSSKRSPILRSARSMNAASATAPNTPSRAASARSSGSAGSSTTSPTSG